MWGEHEGMGWWMLFGSVWFVVFWFFARILRRPGSRERWEESALEILRRRYARGEISRAEYEAMRRDIT